MRRSVASSIGLFAGGGACVAGILYAFPHLDARWVGLVCVVIALIPLAERGTGK